MLNYGIFTNFMFCRLFIEKEINPAGKEEQKVAKAKLSVAT